MRLFKITHKTPGLGSNGKEQRERDGLFPSLRYQTQEVGWTFAGEARLQLSLKVVKAQVGDCNQPVLCKTGYGPAVDNRQVPSPITFQKAR